MNISYESFLNWAQKNFDYVSQRGDEILVDSIFTHDQKQHLSCNPYKNAYHCWKSGEHGNLFNLVSIVNKCSYKEAISELCDTNPIRMLEQKVNKLMEEKRELPKVINEIELPPHTFPITSLTEDNQFRLRAETFMTKRKLPCTGLLVCISGKYKNRIVIPYYAPDGTLIYWNSRDITGMSNVLRYQGPDKAIGVGKSQVMWMKEWPEANSKIYLTEGEFDAMSLIQSGFLAGAMGGKELHERQVELLHKKQYERLTSYKICLATDNDKSGKEALHKIGINLLSNGIREVSYVQPPVGHKDWNDLLVKEGDRIVAAYIQQREQIFDPWTPVRFLAG